MFDVSQLKRLFQAFLCNFRLPLPFAKKVSQMEAIVYLKFIQNFRSNAISLNATKRVTRINSLSMPQLKLGNIRVIFRQSLCFIWKIGSEET